MTVSGGVASFPQNAGSQDELVQLARAALLDARAAGGGRISAHEPDGHHGPQPDAPEPCAPRAVSADARATSEYAGLLAGELGLDADRIERLRLAAYVYGTADDAGGAGPGRRRRAGRRVRRVDPRPARGRRTSGRWRRGSCTRPTRSCGPAATPRRPAPGRALAGLFEAGDEIDADCLRALERLLAADAA